MGDDPSEGYEAAAEAFVTARSPVGAAEVRAWARTTLPPGASVLDVGCGSGAPVAEALIEAGFAVAGIDASPSLLAEFRRRLPDAPAACETVQDSAFFGRRFDAALAIGLLFLLSEDDQRLAIRRLAKALKPGGRLLFTAPPEPCTRTDALTGRLSRSLGHAEYGRLLQAAGLDPVGGFADAGGNRYRESVNRPRSAMLEQESGRLAVREGFEPSKGC